MRSRSRSLLAETAYGMVNVGSLRSATVGKYLFHVNVWMESLNDLSKTSRYVAFVDGAYVVGSAVGSNGHPAGHPRRW